MSYTYIKFQGIVIRRQNYREKDMIVNILTDRFGFKNFFFRNVQRKKFKLQAGVFPFSIGTYIGKINDRGLSFINDIYDADKYSNIINDILLNAYSSYILELARLAFSKDILYSTKWFNQIKLALYLIDNNYDPSIITNIMEVQFLDCFGVKPKWNACVVCNSNKGDFDYSEHYGGILCQKHWNNDMYRLHLDSKTIFFLRKFSKIDLQKVKSINVKSITKDKLRKALDEIYNNQVGIYLKPKRFLDQINVWDQKFF